MPAPHPHDSDHARPTCPSTPCMPSPHQAGIRVPGFGVRAGEMAAAQLSAGFESSAVLGRGGSLFAMGWVPTCLTALSSRPILRVPCYDPRHCDAAWVQLQRGRQAGGRGVYQPHCAHTHHRQQRPHLFSSCPPSGVSPPSLLLPTTTCCYLPAHPRMTCLHICSLPRWQVCMAAGRHHSVAVLAPPGQCPPSPVTGRSQSPIDDSRRRVAVCLSLSLCLPLCLSACLVVHLPDRVIFNTRCSMAQAVWS